MAIRVPVAKSVPPRAPRRSSRSSRSSRPTSARRAMRAPPSSRSSARACVRRRFRAGERDARTWRDRAVRLRRRGAGRGDRLAQVRPARRSRATAGAPPPPRDRAAASTIRRRTSIPVPLYRARAALRGFNQAALLAAPVARALDATLRPRRPRPQAATPPRRPRSRARRAFATSTTPSSPARRSPARACSWSMTSAPPAPRWRPARRRCAGQGRATCVRSCSPAPNDVQRRKDPDWSGRKPAQSSDKPKKRPMIPDVSADTDWRWADPSGQQRLVRTDELRAALASGLIAPNTPVWRSGWKEWKPAHEVPELTTSALSAANGVVPNIPPPPMAMVAVQRAYEGEPKADPSKKHSEPPPPPTYVPAPTRPQPGVFHTTPSHAMRPHPVPKAPASSRQTGVARANDTAGATASVNVNTKENGPSPDGSVGLAALEAHLASKIAARVERERERGERGEREERLRAAVDRAPRRRRRSCTSVRPFRRSDRPKLHACRLAPTPAPAPIALSSLVRPGRSRRRCRARPRSPRRRRGRSRRRARRTRGRK